MGKFKIIDYSLYTSFHIGGKLNTFFPDTMKELNTMALNYDFEVIGQGTNSVVKNKTNKLFLNLNFLNSMKIEENNIIVQSGTSCNKFSNFVCSKNYTGAEWLFYLPGNIGGALFSNASFYREHPISENLINIKILTKKGVKLVYRENIINQFGWRSSPFKNKESIILEATFNFKKTNSYSIEKELKEVFIKRKEQYKKIGRKGYTFGTFFKNVDFLKNNINLIKTWKYKNLYMPKKLIGWVINTGNSTLADLLYYYKILCEEVKKELDMEVSILG